MRRRKAVLVLALLFGASTQQAGASDTATLTISRHRTDNAFGSQFLFADWYHALRGTLGLSRDTGSGTFRLEGTLHARAFDTYAIEDDRDAALAAAYTHRFGERVELRGSLGWRGENEGDDLVVDDTIIGIRTVTHTLEAKSALGVALGGGWAAALDGALAREMPGRTRFEAEIIEPLKLFAIKDRLELGARLGRTQGGLTLALTGGAEYVRAGREADAPYRFDLARHRAGTEAGWSNAAGWQLAGAVGVERLALADGTLATTRPVFAASAAIPLPANAVLKANVAGRFDTRHEDDPVASYLLLAEASLAVPLGERFKVSAGALASRRDWLSLEGWEQAVAGFGEVTYRISPPVDLTFRTERRRSVFDDGAVVPKLDFSLALAARM